MKPLSGHREIPILWAMKRLETSLPSAAVTMSESAMAAPRPLSKIGSCRLLLAVAAISGAFALAGNEPVAELRIEIGGEVTGLSYPLRVRTRRGAAIVESAKTKLPLIANERYLQPLHLHGYGDIWLLAPPGESLTLVEQPCCGITLMETERTTPICPKAVDGGPCPDGAEAGDSSCLCPPGTRPLRPELADDPRCGPAGRCIAMPRLRRLESDDGTSIQLEDGTEVTSEYRSVSMGPGQSVRIVVAGSTSWLALSSEGSYIIVTDHEVSGPFVRRRGSV